MSNQEKYIGKSSIIGNPTKKLIFSLEDNAVTSSKIAPSSILYSHLSKAVQDILDSFATKQELRNKADRVAGATNGNFAALDANGNLVDSGHGHDEYLTTHQSLSNYIQKSQVPGLVKNDGSIDTNMYLTEHQDISGKANTSDLATVAISGSYLDLTDKPTIPTDTNTHRPIQVEGAEILGSSMTPLNFVPGSNVSLTYNNNAVIINAINSTYSASSFDIKDLKDTTSLRNRWSGKQDELVSGVNIKTINNISILGSGNIDIEGGAGNGDDNIIEVVKINDIALEPDEDKAVNIDLSNYVQKSSTSGLLKNDGTVDTNTYLTQHQDISGKADKSEMSVTASGDTTTIQLKSGTSATVINQHQSLSGKQDVIDSSHKLSADLVEDGTTNKVINVKPDWNAAAGDAAEILNKPTIPTVPAISTDISADGSSDVKTASPKAVKTYVDSNAPTVMGASGSGHKGGLVPDTPSTAGTTKFLREDGTWEVPAAGGSVPSNVALLEDASQTAFSPNFDPEIDTVHVSSQSLTTAQKTQARTNIGAADASTAVNSSVIRNIVTISQSDYTALSSKDNNTLYIIT